MSQPDPSARPSQVTVAGWAVAVTSVVLVVAVFDAMSQLESIEMRERLARAISSGSAKDLGFTVGDAIEVVRWCLTVSGVAAAGAGVLGVFVLQGHRGARIALTVAAALIVLTASVAGSFPGFLGMLIGVGTALLWTRPARDWFAGRPITRPQPREAAPVNPPSPAPPVAWAPPEPGTEQPPPTQGWGQLPGPPYAALPPEAASWPAPVVQLVPEASPTRPPQVRIACILTWVFSSATAFGFACVLLAMAIDQDRLVEELRKSPAWEKSFDVDTVTTVVATASVILVVWSLAAIALAVLVWRRTRWAWALLVISAWMAGLVSVLAFPYSLFSLPYLAVIGASLGMLMRRPTRDWFAETPHPSRPTAPRPPVW